MASDEAVASEQITQQPGGDAAQSKSEGSASFLRAARAGNLDKVLELLRSGIDINTCNANGLNALHLASKEGHHEVVRELLKRKANVDAATKKGNTALHIASLAGQALIVTILVENNANVNVQSQNGFTALYMAAQENHVDVVRYLLSHGADQELSTKDGFNPQAVALQQGHERIVGILLENYTHGKVRLPALHIAAKKDDSKAATLLLQNEQNADVTSKSGFTPLHIAAHYGNENVAQLFLEKGANVNYQARHNISPLHVATKWGRVNMVNLLLDNGAIIDSRTRDLLTPLHCAARSGHDTVVDLLIEKGAPISAKTKNGLAPLHMAAQGDHVDSARILVYHRAPVDDVTVDYLTPLHVAAHCGHVRVAKLLLDRNADPNARALNGFTPLHIACKKNRIKVVELLLKYHASIEATTESGLSPLHVAAFMGAINIVIYLLQQGANPDVATIRGETPLHLAARANQTDIVRVLLRNGAKVDAQARELQTPLHIASRLGNTDIVVLLLQAGANPNSATRDQYTPLHIAAKEGQEEVAAILLDHNADKHVLTKKGFTPLHLASKYGNVEVAKLLLERGTPVDIEGKNQVTPLHVAAHYNNDKVALLLLENGASATAAAKNGYTPLHIAAKKNQMDIATTLLHYKAEPNAKSRAGFTPLHLAAQEGHREMSGLLIEHGADVGAKANNGLTAMHLCAQEDRVPVAEELYNHQADVNAQTNAGYTPLHVACHFGQLNMVRFLVEHGARVGETTRASYTPLHQAAQQGHNNCVRYLLENGASPNAQTASGQTPLSIAQRLGYVSVVETLKTVTETTVITETTTVTEERYKPQNPEGMNETMFSESEDEVDDHHAAQVAHAKDFSDNLTAGLQDSTGVHLIHTGEQVSEQLLQRSSELEPTAVNTVHGQHGEADLETLIRKAQAHPVSTAVPDNTMIESMAPDNVPLGQNVTQPSKLQHKTFLISFLVDARGGAMRGCRHSGVRIIIPPRKAGQPIRVTCRYLRKDKLAHPPPLSEGEELASRILEMAPAGAKFLGPVILEVPHFASLREREREIVILRSDDGQHWKEHQLEATEDAVQEVLNESFDAEELAALDDLHTPRITRILTNDFPMYFAVVTRVRQEVHCVGPEGGVIMSSVVPRVQAIFPDGSLTKTIKVSLQAQPVPHEMVTRLHGNRVAVSPIVTVEPRRRKFHKPITLCIPLPQSSNKGMLTQYSGQPGQEPPTLRLLCSITGGSAPAQWEDITGTTQLTFTGDEVSFTTTVSARFWLMDCQTPRDAARMAQEVYNEAIAIPYMAKFCVFARRTFPIEGQLRVFCMTDDKEDKTLEKQEHFKQIAKSRDVEVLKGKHQFLEFAGGLVPVTHSGDQLSLYFLPFQENRLAFMVKTRQKDDSQSGEAFIAFMREPKVRAESLPPQQPICTLQIQLPEYTGEVPAVAVPKKDLTPFDKKYQGALDKDLPEFIHPNVLKYVGPDWQRLGRALDVPHRDIQHIKHTFPGQELKNMLKIWIHLKKTEATSEELDNSLRRIGRDDIPRSIAHGEPEDLSTYSSASPSESRRDIIKGDIAKVTAPPAVTSSIAKHAIKTEEAVSEDTPRESGMGYSAPEPSFERAEIVHPDIYASHPAEQPIPEEDEDEVPVSEVRTVVRTERHVHDTENGPVVKEKTISTTYEDDVAVNESVVEREVPLNEEEQTRWDELHAADLETEQSASLAELQGEVPEGAEVHTETERHIEDDGTVVTTTTTSAHYTTEEPEDERTSVHGESSEEGDIGPLQASGAQDSTAESGTTQKKESAEEGFTNDDGSVVVSKKMTRIVTTTRTTLPGEGDSAGSESPKEQSPTESLGSVKDRIAIFESIASKKVQEEVTSEDQDQRPEEPVLPVPTLTEEVSREGETSSLPVEIIVTPVTPTPRGEESDEEIRRQEEIHTDDEHPEKVSEERKEPESPEERAPKRHFDEFDGRGEGSSSEGDDEDQDKPGRKIRRTVESVTRTSYHVKKEGREREDAGAEGFEVEERPFDFSPESAVGGTHEEEPIERTTTTTVTTEYMAEREQESSEATEVSEYETEEDEESGEFRRVRKVRRTVEKITKTSYHIKKEGQEEEEELPAETAETAPYSEEISKLSGIQHEEEPASHPAASSVTETVELSPSAKEAKEDQEFSHAAEPSTVGEPLEISEYETEEDEETGEVRRVRKVRRTVEKITKTSYHIKKEGQEGEESVVEDEAAGNLPYYEEVSKPHETHPDEEPFYQTTETTVTSEIREEPEEPKEVSEYETEEDEETGEVRRVRKIRRTVDTITKTSYHIRKEGDQGEESEPDYEHAEAERLAAQTPPETTNVESQLAPIPTIRTTAPHPEDLSDDREDREEPVTETYISGEEQFELGESGQPSVRSGIETVTTTTYMVQKADEEGQYPPDTLTDDAVTEQEAYSHTEDGSVTSPIGDHDSQGRTLDGTKDETSDEEYGTMRQTTETAEYHVEPVPEEDLPRREEGETESEYEAEGDERGHKVLKHTTEVVTTTTFHFQPEKDEYREPTSAFETDTTKVAELRSSPSDEIITTGKYADATRKTFPEETHVEMTSSIYEPTGEPTYDESKIAELRTSPTEKENLAMTTSIYEPSEGIAAYESRTSEWRSDEEFPKDMTTSIYMPSDETQIDESKLADIRRSPSSEYQDQVMTESLYAASSEPEVEESKEAEIRMTSSEEDMTKELSTTTLEHKEQKSGEKEHQPYELQDHTTEDLTGGSLAEHDGDENTDEMLTSVYRKSEGGESESYDHSEESDHRGSPSMKDKSIDLAKKAGLIAGGIAVAPFALAAYGAATAVSVLRADATGEYAEHPDEEHVLSETAYKEDTITTERTTHEEPTEEYPYDRHTPVAETQRKRQAPECSDGQRRKAEHAGEEYVKSEPTYTETVITTETTTYEEPLEEYPYDRNSPVSEIQKETQEEMDLSDEHRAKEKDVAEHVPDVPAEPTYTESVMTTETTNYEEPIEDHPYDRHSYVAEIQQETPEAREPSEDHTEKANVMDKEYVPSETASTETVITREITTYEEPTEEFPYDRHSPGTVTQKERQRALEDSEENREKAEYPDEEHIPSEPTYTEAVITTETTTHEEPIEEYPFGRHSPVAEAEKEMQEEPDRSEEHREKEEHPDEEHIPSEPAYTETVITTATTTYEQPIEEYPYDRHSPVAEAEKEMQEEPDRSEEHREKEEHPDEEHIASEPAYTETVITTATTTYEQPIEEYPYDRHSPVAEAEKEMQEEPDRSEEHREKEEHPDEEHIPSEPAYTETVITTATTTYEQPIEEYPYDRHSPVAEAEKEMQEEPDRSIEHREKAEHPDEEHIPSKPAYTETVKTTETITYEEPVEEYSYGRHEDESYDNSEEPGHRGSPSMKEKSTDLAKKAGLIAGGIAAAPFALAAYGAATAVSALRGDATGEHAEQPEEPFPSETAYTETMMTTDTTTNEEPVEEYLHDRRSPVAEIEKKKQEEPDLSEEQRKKAERADGEYIPSASTETVSTAESTTCGAPVEEYQYDRHSPAATETQKQMQKVPVVSEEHREKTEHPDEAHVPAEQAYLESVTTTETTTYEEPIEEYPYDLNSPVAETQKALQEEPHLSEERREKAEHPDQEHVLSEPAYTETVITTETTTYGEPVEEYPYDRHSPVAEAEKEMQAEPDRSEEHREKEEHPEEEHIPSEPAYTENVITTETTTYEKPVEEYPYNRCSPVAEAEKETQEEADLSEEHRVKAEHLDEEHIPSEPAYIETVITADRTTYREPIEEYPYDRHSPIAEIEKETQEEETDISEEHREKAGHPNEEHVPSEPAYTETVTTTETTTYEQPIEEYPYDRHSPVAEAEKEIHEESDLSEEHGEKAEHPDDEHALSEPTYTETVMTTKTITYEKPVEAYSYDRHEDASSGHSEESGHRGSPSMKDKSTDLAKKAGLIAGGIAAAPFALAAYGAATAVSALRGDATGEHADHQEEHVPYELAYRETAISTETTAYKEPVEEYPYDHHSPVAAARSDMREATESSQEQREKAEHPYEEHVPSEPAYTETVITTETTTYEEPIEQNRYDRHSPVAQPEKEIQAEPDHSEEHREKAEHPDEEHIPSEQVYAETVSTTETTTYGEPIEEYSYDRRPPVVETEKETQVEADLPEKHREKAEHPDEEHVPSEPAYTETVITTETTTYEEPIEEYRYDRHSPVAEIEKEMQEEPDHSEDHPDKKEHPDEEPVPSEPVYTETVITTETTTHEKPIEEYPFDRYSPVAVTEKEIQEEQDLSEEHRDKAEHPDEERILSEPAYTETVITTETTTYEEPIEENRYDRHSPVAQIEKEMQEEPDRSEEHGEKEEHPDEEHFPSEPAYTETVKTTETITYEEPVEEYSYGRHEDASYDNSEEPGHCGSPSMKEKSTDLAKKAGLIAGGIAAAPFALAAYGAATAVSALRGDATDHHADHQEEHVPHEPAYTETVPTRETTTYEETTEEYPDDHHSPVAATRRAMHEVTEPSKDQRERADHAEVGYIPSAETETVMTTERTPYDEPIEEYSYDRRTPVALIEKRIQEEPDLSDKHRGKAEHPDEEHVSSEPAYTETVITTETTTHEEPIEEYMFDRHTPVSETEKETQVEADLSEEDREKAEHPDEEHVPSEPAYTETVITTETTTYEEPIEEYRYDRHSPVAEIEKEMQEEPDHSEDHPDKKEHPDKEPVPSEPVYTETVITTETTTHEEPIEEYPFDRYSPVAVTDKEIQEEQDLSEEHRDKAEHPDEERILSEPAYTETVITTETTTYEEPIEEYPFDRQFPVAETEKETQEEDNLSEEHQNKAEPDEEHITPEAAYTETVITTETTTYEKLIEEYRYDRHSPVAEVERESEEESDISEKHREKAEYAEKEQVLSEPAYTETVITTETTTYGEPVEEYPYDRHSPRPETEKEIQEEADFSEEYLEKAEHPDEEHVPSEPVDAETAITTETITYGQLDAAHVSSHDETVTGHDGESMISTQEEKEIPVTMYEETEQSADRFTHPSDVDSLAATIASETVKSVVSVETMAERVSQRQQADDTYVTSEYNAEEDNLPHDSRETGPLEKDSFGQKLFGFAKKAGMIAGGAVAAPVALAAMGAKEAYKAVKKRDSRDDRYQPVATEDYDTEEELPAESDQLIESAHLEESIDDRELPLEEAGLVVRSPIREHPSPNHDHSFSPVDRDLLHEEAGFVVESTEALAGERAVSFQEEQLPTESPAETQPSHVIDSTEYETPDHDRPISPVDQELLHEKAGFVDEYSEALKDEGAVSFQEEQLPTESPAEIQPSHVIDSTEYETPDHDRPISPVDQELLHEKAGFVDEYSEALKDEGAASFQEEQLPNESPAEIQPSHVIDSTEYETPDHDRPISPVDQELLHEKAGFVDEYSEALKDEGSVSFQEEQLPTESPAEIQPSHVIDSTEYETPDHDRPISPVDQELLHEKAGFVDEDSEALKDEGAVSFQEEQLPTESPAEIQPSHVIDSTEYETPDHDMPISPVDRELLCEEVEIVVENAEAAEDVGSVSFHEEKLPTESPTAEQPSHVTDSTEYETPVHDRPISPVDRELLHEDAGFAIECAEALKDAGAVSFQEEQLSAVSPTEQQPSHVIDSTEYETPDHDRPVSPVDRELLREEVEFVVENAEAAEDVGSVSFHEEKLPTEIPTDEQPSHVIDSTEYETPDHDRPISPVDRGLLHEDAGFVVECAEALKDAGAVSFQEEQLPAVSPTEQQPSHVIDSTEYETPDHDRPVSPVDRELLREEVEFVVENAEAAEDVGSVSIQEEKLPTESPTDEEPSNMIDSTNYETPDHDMPISPVDRELLREVEIVVENAEAADDVGSVSFHEEQLPAVSPTEQQPSHVIDSTEYEAPDHDRPFSPVERELLHEESGFAVESTEALMDAGDVSFPEEQRPTESPTEDQPSYVIDSTEYEAPDHDRPISPVDRELLHEEAVFAVESTEALKDESAVSFQEEQLPTESSTEEQPSYVIESTEYEAPYHDRPISPVDRDQLHEEAVFAVESAEALKDESAVSFQEEQLPTESSTEEQPSHVIESTEYEAPDHDRPVSPFDRELPHKEAGFAVEAAEALKDTAAVSFQEVQLPASSPSQEQQSHVIDSTEYESPDHDRPVSPVERELLHEEAVFVVEPTEALKEAGDVSFQEEQLPTHSEEQPSHVIDSTEYETPDHDSTVSHVGRELRREEAGFVVDSSAALKDADAVFVHEEQLPTVSPIVEQPSHMADSTAYEAPHTDRREDQTSEFSVEKTEAIAADNLTDHDDFQLEAPGSGGVSAPQSMTSDDERAPISPQFDEQSFSVVTKEDIERVANFEETKDVKTTPENISEADDFEFVGPAEVSAEATASGAEQGWSEKFKDGAKTAGLAAGAVLAAPFAAAAFGVKGAIDSVKKQMDESSDSQQEHPEESSDQLNVSSTTQSPDKLSSVQDETIQIADESDWKVYNSKGEIVEEFSAQLVEDAVVDATEDTALRPSIPSPRQLLKQESCNEIAIEPEVDYQSDLQEKLDILAAQSQTELPMLKEEEDGDDHDHVLIERDEEELQTPVHEDVIQNSASRLVDDVLSAIVEDSQTNAESQSLPYHTATTQSRDYDTAVTSQSTSFQSAQQWTSQDSEYTTAPSDATSVVDIRDEQRGVMTPTAMVSPLEEEKTLSTEEPSIIPTIRSFEVVFDESKSSTPDVLLKMEGDDESPESESGGGHMQSSPSGVLLAPEIDPGRPVSPIPPTRTDSGIFVGTKQPEDTITVEQCLTPDILEFTADSKVNPLLKKALDQSIHEKAMELEKTEMSYSRQMSDLSSESAAETVIHAGAREAEELIESQITAVSTDSLDKVSMKSGGSGKRYSTSRRSSSSASGSGKTPERETVDYEKFGKTESSEGEDAACEQTTVIHTETEVTQTFETTFEETPILDQAEHQAQTFETYSTEETHAEATEAEPLETLHEEPEDNDSLNGSGSSSAGPPAALIGKYKHVSSDNISESSLQEFERIEQAVLNRGESSLTSSELELYVAGSRLRGSAEGSTNSLSEFEKLEQELSGNGTGATAAGGSPKDEDVMMLSDIREESEAEDMSVRDDEEDDNNSVSDVKIVPLTEDEERIATPTQLSPADSIERGMEIITSANLLEQSTDSLEPTTGIELMSSSPRRDSLEESSLTEYEVVAKMHESLRDSLENLPHDRDSLLEGGTSQEMTMSQDTQGILSGDTVGTYQEHDEDEDSLTGEVDTMLSSYPTTLTTFETTKMNDDGTVETISRRVETRVHDPVVSHVTFTGTENEERLRQLPLEEQFETVDAEGNVTRTIIHRQTPKHQH